MDQKPPNAWPWILLGLGCLLAAPVTTLFGRPGNILDLDVPLVPALLAAAGAACAMWGWRARRRRGSSGVGALILATICFCVFVFSSYVLIDHRLHPRYEYARLTGVSGCAEQPTRSTADGLAVGTLPDALVQQLSTTQPIWVVDEPHAFGRRVVVALHGQHNSFYAGIAKLSEDGWKNTELAAGRAEHRGVLHRNGMSIRYLTQGGQALFCVGSDTSSQIGLMAQYVFTSMPPEGKT
jgi:hypothetical protein